MANETEQFNDELAQQEHDAKLDQPDVGSEAERDGVGSGGSSGSGGSGSANSIGSRQDSRLYEDDAWQLYSLRDLYEHGDDFGSYRLSFRCNPSQYSFDLPIRQSVTMSKGGPIFHVFRDVHRNNTNTGFGTLSIDFQSGNILPLANVAYGKGGSDKYLGVPSGLLNFYRYLEIVNQPNVYKDEEGNVKDNYRVLSISTRMFPKLDVVGFISDKVGFGENADNPNEIQSWNATFQIVYTIPSLSQAELAYSLSSAWREEMGASDTDYEDAFRKGSA